MPSTLFSPIEVDSKILPHFTKIQNIYPRVFAEMDSNIVYYGIELEMGYTATSPDQFIAQTNEVKNWFDSKDIKMIFVHDGSISDSAELIGCEIVVQPLTIIQLYNAFRDFWDCNTNFVTNNNVGMHVHVSKQGLFGTKNMNLSLTKLVCFINLPENQGFIEYISGRPNNRRYAELSKKTIIETFQQRNRYQAINNENPETVEFRMYRTPNNYNEFKARLEFTEAICTYCRTCNLSELHYSDFQDWLEKRAYRSNRFLYLYEYLKDKV